MKGKITFKIEDKLFYLADNFTKVNSFGVDSIPRPYKVIWQDKLRPYELINELVSENKKNLLLIDKNIYGIFSKYLKIDKNRIFFAEATEKFKTLNGIIDMIGFLQKNNFTKGEKLIVVGGGIIQDVGAFVGACYKRGIPWVHLPTTLLSMCDSCIGGKTGINYNNAKNQLGLFSAPYQVIINPIFLNGLKERELRSGLGEILKLSITGGKQLVSDYKKLVSGGKVVKHSAYKQLILGALGVKRSIVEIDEFDLNYRQALNYGHTVGHAIEALSEYRIPHGQAVVLGMIIANELSSRLSMLGQREKEELDRLLFDLLDMKTVQGIALSGIKELLKKDKKASGKFINFVMLKSIGNIKFVSLKIDSSFADEISAILSKIIK